MIETAIKEDLILDKKLIIPKNKLDAIRIMNELHPVVGGQPTHEKDQPNDNNPILDLACTLANIHASGVGEHADLRSIQNEPPKFFYGEGFISGISSLKGNGILAIFGHWRDGSGKYAIKQFYYTDKEISYRNALSEDKWSAWIDVLTSNSQLDYNKLLNVPITSTLSDDKNKIASIFSVNEVNRKAVNAQKTADLANDKAVEANNNANKRSLKTETLLRKGSLSTTNLNDVTEVGNYYQTQNAQATTARNYPKKLAGNLFVLEAKGGATDCIQIYTTYSTNKLFVRNKYGATWSAWKETADELDVVKAQARADAAFTRIKPIAEGGTGATAVAQARTNLGLKGAALVDLTSTLSDAKDLAASIFSVNEINRKVNTAQTTANNADAKAIKAQNTADKKRDLTDGEFKDVQVLTNKNVSIRGALFLNEDSIYLNKNNGSISFPNKNGVFALTSDCLGVGQRWVRPDRAAGSTYYNATGKPILVNVTVGGNVHILAATPILYVDNVAVSSFYRLLNTSVTSADIPLSAIVPAGSSYWIDPSGLNITSWAELRS